MQDGDGEFMGVRVGEDMGLRVENDEVRGEEMKRGVEKGGKLREVEGKVG